MSMDTMLPVVVLAGGASSRFAPFQRYGKSLVRMMGRTILGHTLERLTVVHPPSFTVVFPPVKGWRERLEEDGVSLTGLRFIEQPEPKGQADAVLTAWTAIKKPSAFIVMNAQHFTAAPIIPRLLSAFSNQDRSLILVKKTDTPWKYGIAKIKGNSVVRVVEKPAAGTEPSPLRIVGMYCLTKDAIETIASLPKSEYQLEEGLNLLARQGKLGFTEIEEEMPTLKYSWDLLNIKDMLLEEKQFIGKSSFIHKTAIIEGPCWIGPNAVVGAFCVLRKGVILEEGAEVQRYVEAKNVIVGKDSHIHSGYIGDSVIGEHCRIGAGFITANRRFDRRNILIEVKGERVDTGMSSLGVFVGDNVSIGIHVGTMPGTVIESGSMVMPGKMMRGIEKSAHLS